MSSDPASSVISSPWQPQLIDNQSFVHYFLGVLSGTWGVHVTPQTVAQWRITFQDSLPKKQGTLQLSQVINRMTSSSRN